MEKYVPEHFKDSIEKKVSIIPNGIDGFWINYTDYPRQETIVSPLRLLHVGDISRRKNIETTVKAIAETILKVCSDDENAERMGQNARVAANEFDFEKLTSKLIDIIENS